MGYYRAAVSVEYQVMSFGFLVPTQCVGIMEAVPSFDQKKNQRTLCTDTLYNDIFVSSEDARSQESVGGDAVQHVRQRRDPGGRPRHGVVPVIQVSFMVTTVSERSGLSPPFTCLVISPFLVSIIVSIEGKSNKCSLRNRDL